MSTNTKTVPVGIDGLPEELGVAIDGKDYDIAVPVPLLHWLLTDYATMAVILAASLDIEPPSMPVATHWAAALPDDAIVLAKTVESLNMAEGLLALTDES